MTLVWLGIAVWVAAIISLLSYRFVQWAHRNTTEADLYYDRLDQKLDDELAARRNTAPHGNCQVIYGPWVRKEPTLPPTVGPFDRSGGAA